MYYRLLQIKANDKAYIPHTSDSIILPIVEYYEKKRGEGHLMEAYYYAGRVYRDLQDAPQALDYFQRAAQISSGSIDYRLISKIYAQIATLFDYQDIYDESLKMFKKAYSYTIMANDSAGMVYALRDLAGSYRANTCIDSSLYCYQKAYSLAHILHQRFLMDLVQNQMASLYIQQKKYDLAWRLLRSSLNNLAGHSKSGVYSIASELYDKTGDIDSATYYYKEILDCGTIYAKQAAHRGLAKIAILEKRPQEALEHLDHYLLCSDSIEKITNIETIRKAQSLYNYQLRERENNRLIVENSKQKSWIIIVFAAFLFLFVSFILYRENSKRRQLQLSLQLNKLENLRNQLYQQSYQAIEDNKKQIEKLVGQIRELEKTNGSQAELLQAQKEQIEKNNILLKFKQEKQRTEEEVFFGSELYVFFRDSNNEGDLKITREHWMALQVEIDRIYNNFTRRLLDLYQFNEFEQHVCLLLKIRFSIKHISLLTVHSKSGIVSTRKRMYAKVFAKSGLPEDWDTFIQSL
jgi:cupin superfamily acireductone dioxygenase involved in methionine salvage